MIFRLDQSLFDQVLEFLVINVIDIVFTPVDLFYPPGVLINTGNLKTDLGLLWRNDLPP